MKKTFDYYRSTNNRLHAAVIQEDNYDKYLKRIQNIVNKKPQIDSTALSHMGFTNKFHEQARRHHLTQHSNYLQTENKILLEKIMNVKNRKNEKDQEIYNVAMHEKRYREQEKINEENKKIALRVTSQSPTIDDKLNNSLCPRQSPRRRVEKSVYESKVKERKLPKLVQIRM